MKIHQNPCLLLTISIHILQMASMNKLNMTLIYIYMPDQLANQLIKLSLFFPILLMGRYNVFLFCYYLLLYYIL